MSFDPAGVGMAVASGDALAASVGLAPGVDEAPPEHPASASATIAAPRKADACFALPMVLVDSQSTALGCDAVRRGAIRTRRNHR
jgi:hypothetical protein